MLKSLEEWQIIPGTNSRYLISTRGRIWHLLKNSDKILRPFGKNYKMVKLRINNKRKYCYIHKLVAKAFIPNPDNLPCINHIDGNKFNNRVENLEWCTYQYNIKEAFRLGLSHNKTGKGNGKSKSVNQYNKNNEFLKKWDSINLAEKQLNIRHISECCKKRRKTAGNFIWKYVEGD